MSRLVAGTEICAIAIDLLIAEAADNGPWRVHLFQNDYIPIRPMELVDFTEATVTGYAAQDIGAFAGATDLGGQVWSMDAPENTFTLDGSVTPQTIYGYYVTDNSEAILYWAERFDSPYMVNGAAFVIVVKPQLTCRSLFGF